MGLLDILLWLAGWAVGALVLYWVIRTAVASGIRDASRKAPRE